MSDGIVIAARKEGQMVIASDIRAPHTGFNPGEAEEPPDLDNTYLVKIGRNWIGAPSGSESLVDCLRLYSLQKADLPTLSKQEQVFEFALDLHKFLVDRCCLTEKPAGNDAFATGFGEMLVANENGLWNVGKQRAVHGVRYYCALGNGFRVANGALEAALNLGLHAEAMVQASVEAVSEFAKSVHPPFQLVAIEEVTPCR